MRGKGEREEKEDQVQEINERNGEKERGKGMRRQGMRERWRKEKEGGGKELRRMGRSMEKRERRERRGEMEEERIVGKVTQGKVEERETGGDRRRNGYGGRGEVYRR